MARSFSCSGANIIYTPYYGSSRGFIVIGNVTFNELTGKITITWDLGFECDPGASGAFVAAVAPYFGGIIYDYEKNLDNGGIYYGDYMVHPRGTVSSQQGSRLASAGSWSGRRTWLSNKTHIIDATTAITYGVRAQMGYGWGWVDRWESSGKYENIYGGTLRFQLPQYDVGYNTNGGSAAPETQIKDYNQTLTLTSSIPTKEDVAQDGYTISFNSNGGSAVDDITVTDTLSYTFNNWNTSPNGSGISYEAGSSYTANSNAVLYAQYNTITSGGSVILPTCDKENYTFVGWSDGTTTYTGVYTPTDNIELTAVWAINPPSGLDIRITRNGTNQFDLQIYASEGIVDSSTILYREQGTATWNTKNAALIIETSIPNLKPDTNYEIGMSATNSGYTVYLGDTQDLSQMAYETYSTRMTKPFTPNITVEELTPFTATISVVSGSEPVRPLSYQFSIDGGVNWSPRQNSNIYTYTNLTEETEYTVSVKVITNPEGINTAETTIIGHIAIITPSDQARAKIKVNDEWKSSKIYMKKDGEWKKIKKLYIKKDGQWIRTKN